MAVGLAVIDMYLDAVMLGLVRAPQNKGKGLEQLRQIHS